MKTTRKHRIVLCAALALGLSMLTACSPGLGGVEQIQDGPPADARFTPAPDAMPAPQASGQLVDGTNIELSDLWQDRVLVAQFTASWCTQCAEAEADLADIARKYEGAVLPVRIALDEPNEDIAEYLATNSAVGPALIDTSGSIWRDYAITEPPVTAIIDTGGGLARMWSGGTDSESLQAVLDELVTIG